jgi:hypothetical protein
MISRTGFRRGIKQAIRYEATVLIAAINDWL